MRRYAGGMRPLGSVWGGGGLEGIEGVGVGLKEV